MKKVFLTVFASAAIFFACSKEASSLKEKHKKSSSYEFESVTSLTTPGAIKLGIERDTEGHLTITKSASTGASIVQSFLVDEGGVNILTGNGEEGFVFTGEGTYYYIPFNDPDDYIEFRRAGEKVTVSCDCSSEGGVCGESGSGSIGGGTHTIKCTSSDCTGCCDATVTITYDTGIISDVPGPGVFVKGTGVSIL